MFSLSIQGEHRKVLDVNMPSLHATSVVLEAEAILKKTFKIQEQIHSENKREQVEENAPLLKRLRLKLWWRDSCEVMIRNQNMIIQRRRSEKR